MAMTSYSGCGFTVTVSRVRSRGWEMNNEDNTIDLIDQLMAQRLDEHGVPLDDYNRNNYDKCPLGEHDWHGTPNTYGCPGAWASEEDKAKYLGGSKSVASLYESVFGSLVDRVTSVVDVFQAADCEPGTVLATLPAQITDFDGSLIDGMITVTAIAGGYSANFHPTESDDSVDESNPQAGQGLWFNSFMSQEDENADVAP